MINFLSLAAALIGLAGLIGKINADKAWQDGCMWARANEYDDEEKQQEFAPWISKLGGALITGIFTAFVITACYLILNP